MFVYLPVHPAICVNQISVSISVAANNLSHKCCVSGWFDIEADKNTNVYVSNLPTNITDEDFTELMSKCGIIMEDPEKSQIKEPHATDW